MSFKFGHQKQQTNFFSIPTGEYDSSHRLPTTPEQHSKATYNLMHGYCTTGRICGAHDPGFKSLSAIGSAFPEGERIRTITVIANHDNFISDMSWDSSHDIPYRRDLGVNYRYDYNQDREEKKKCDIPLLTSLMVFLLTAPARILPSWGTPISSSNRCAFAQLIGSDGICGTFHPSTLVTFSYAGTEGEPGSPGYT